MRRIGVLAGLLSTTVVAGLVACGSNSQPSRSARPIVVFAAASLRQAFTKISELFATENSGARIDFDFAGSSELAMQLTQGATADVFASADTAHMDTVAKAGLLAGNPTNFAANTLVIVTAPDNPKNVASFADLGKPGLAVVVCQRPVPCGSAARRIEDTTGVRLNPVSEEPNVADVLNKVTTGQADAALVYVTDALSAGNKVVTVEFPEAARAVNAYPIAVLQKAPQPTSAKKFVAMVTSEAGQQILAQSGFAKP
ncbi:molybdate ABC transporter substrate-binding protein [Mycobacterium lacus]|uniref:Molybdate-binding protein n=1 Tax=Mycobacterium lacus TaxID=169765 RepID=A0A1X1XVN5_9MYCO|nr:molybdate ABC transporter substrate-binding protein [Mycobacterium lacus]MCV7125414.1 molybdate ABC transporter substrate-binding protein [Mycobacterium lacus]ORW02841.1 molybdate-binding protein [Mycobacterium lacus]BBX96503.1 molybdate-binding protein [Mycobacterium lacus]